MALNGNYELIGRHYLTSIPKNWKQKDIEVLRLRIEGFDQMIMFQRVQLQKVVLEQLKRREELAAIL